MPTNPSPLPGVAQPAPQPAPQPTPASPPGSENVAPAVAANPADQAPAMMPTETTILVKSKESLVKGLDTRMLIVIIMLLAILIGFVLFVFIGRPFG